MLKETEETNSLFCDIFIIGNIPPPPPPPPPPLRLRVGRTFFQKFWLKNRLLLTWRR